MKRKTTIWIIVLVALIIGLVCLVKVPKYYPSEITLDVPQNFFGVTFSKKFAEELELDWREAFIATIDDLDVKYIRLPIYWDEVERANGVFDFSNYDYMIKQGEIRDVKFILNLGFRLPRWPECHIPQWTERLDEEAKRAAVLDYLKVAVGRYKYNTNVVYWQVENEPFLGSFGICPEFDQNFLKQEIDLVKELDDREIIISASGELGGWYKEGKLADIFATTMYRVVHNSWFGYFRYPFPVEFYNFKARATGNNLEESFIIELQTEPWVPSGTMMDLTEKQIDKSMSLDQFKANLQYAINTDFKQTYLWGVEWWYWQKLNGDGKYWRLAKTLFAD